jgi:hypothetical protein
MLCRLGRGENRDTMIRVNELRMDNYILFKKFGEGEGKIGQMKAGDFGRVKCDDPENSEYHPIPLTPEWLKRCGFEKDNFAQIKEDGGFDVREKWVSADKEVELFLVVLAGKYMTGDNPCYGRKMKGFHRYQPIVSIHQLQNLYFALTGDELNIDL